MKIMGISASPEKGGFKDGNEKAALELTKQLIKQIKERKINI